MPRVRLFVRVIPLLVLLGTGTVSGMYLACSVAITLGLLMLGLVSFERTQRSFVDIA